MWNYLILLAKIDLMEREINSDFEFFSDIHIIKAFRLPVDTQVTDLHEGTWAYQLLKNRKERPSRQLWKECIQIADSVNSSNSALFAAELYFDVLIKDKSEEEHVDAPDFEKQIVEEKRYPPRDDTRPDDAMPNVTGGMADVGGGTFLSADDKKKEKDCDT